jgi:hypothetical protein
MKPHGGTSSVSTLTSLPRHYGRKHARFGRLPSSRATIRQGHRTQRLRTQHRFRGRPTAHEIANRSQLSRPAPNDHFQADRGQNRRNARNSTSPVTEEGKQRSRCNAESPDRLPAMVSLPRGLDDPVTMRIVCLGPGDLRIAAPKAASRSGAPASVSK